MMIADTRCSADNAHILQHIVHNREGMEMSMDVKTNVIKRNGKEVSFDISKIVNAITKAN